LYQQNIRPAASVEVHILHAQIAHVVRLHVDLALGGYVLEVVTIFVPAKAKKAM
jgi:hypothetical protein